MTSTETSVEKREAYVLRDANGRAIMIASLGPECWESTLAELAAAGPGSTLTREPLAQAKEDFLAAMADSNEADGRQQDDELVGGHE